MILEINDMQVRYGNIRALKGISLNVGEGEIVTLIGSNGAGKSTLLNSVIGLVPKAAGTVRFMGEDITGRSTHEIVRMGIGYSPEGRNICQKLSVYENLEVGFYTRKDPAEKQRSLEYVYELFPILKERSRQQAGTLSGGEQQMLAIGRALMSAPKLLMMDEPAAGMNPQESEELMHFVVGLRDEGFTILMIEHDMRIVMNISDRIYVMDYGKLIAQGTPKEIAVNPDVIRAYLGESEDEA